MLLAGDIRLLGVTDPGRPFARLKGLLAAEDVVFGNLEGALTDAVDAHEHYSKVGWLHAGTAGAEALREGHFAVVGLANNVMIGATAIEATVSRLDAMGIAHTGAGMDLQAARAPAIVERAGVRYGFIQRTSIFWPAHHRAVPTGSYELPDRRYVMGHVKADQRLEFFGAPGVATLRGRTAYEPSYASIYEAGGAAIIHTWPDPDELREFLADIRQLRPQVDVLVTSHHWRLMAGNFYNNTGDVARDYRVEIAHAAIDAGADLVIGHGTHEIDEIEVYNGKVIFYGLGEIFFGRNPERAVLEPEETREPQPKLLARAEVVDKRITRISCRFVVPGGRLTAAGDGYETELRSPAEVPRAVAHLEALSKKFGTTLQVDEHDLTIRA